MKVLQINTFYKYGSTGRIAYDLLCAQNDFGLEGFVAYGPKTAVNKSRNNDTHLLCLQSMLRRKVNILRTRLFDHHGFYNESETRKLIRWMDEIHPDIIHLHNLHNHYVNVKMLFDYIKLHDIPVVWTLHDCWSMTGHCSHFDFVKCDKWKTECTNCTLRKSYPPTWFFDKSTRNFKDKRTCFSGVNNLTIVSPSEWLASIVRQSFLKKYIVHVINNGVDTDVFAPSTSQKNDIKQRLGIKGKKMILAVMPWQKNKGTDYITKLADCLNENEVLVVVGLKSNEIKKLPHKNCIGISRTNSIEELAAFYSAADVFINPTLEDTFPTTNIEALACGTPVVTFRTGGSIEAVLDDEIINKEGRIKYTSVGAVVEKGNIDDLLVAVRKVINFGKQYYLNNCVCKARKKYDKGKQYQKYIELYNSLMK